MTTMSHKDYTTENKYRLSPFMVAGALTTYFLIPETRDHKGKSRSLEELAEGRVVLRELNQKRRDSVD